MDSLFDNLNSRPPSERNLLLTMPYRLAEQGQQDRLKILLTTFDFLRVKLAENGIESLLNDYDTSDDPALRSIQKALRLSAHILSESPDQLGPQLQGRLDKEDSAIVFSLLDAIKGEKPSLRPLFPSLTPPSDALIRTVQTGWGKFTVPRGRAIGSRSDIIPRLFYVLPDGSSVLVAAGREVKIWNIDSGEVTASVRFKSDFHITAATLLPNSNLLIAMYKYSNSKEEPGEGRFFIFDPSSEKILRWFKAPDKPIEYIYYVGDRGYILLGSLCFLNLVALETGSVIQRIGESERSANEGFVFFYVFPEKHQVLTASFDTLKFWDYHSGELIYAVTPQNVFKSKSLRFGQIELGHWTVLTIPQKNLILSSRNKKLVLWNLENGHEVRKYRKNKLGDPLLALPDGQHIFMAKDDTLTLWNWKTEQTVRTYDGKGSPFNKLCLFPNGRHLASLHADGTLRYWEVATGKVPESGLRHDDEITCVLNVPGEERVLTASTDGILKLWDLRTRTLLHTFKGHTGKITKVILHPDRCRILSAAEDKTVRVWSLKSGQELLRLGPHDDHIKDVAVLPGGHQVVTADGKSIRVWDIIEGKYLRGYHDKEFGAGALAVLPDGQHIVAAYDYGLVHLLDIGNCDVIRSFGGDLRLGSGDANLCVTPDGRYVILGFGHILQAWDRETGRELPQFDKSGWTRNGERAVVLPDGERILTDPYLAVWHLGQGWKKDDLTSDHSLLDVSPDGQVAASAQFKKISIWDIEQSILLAEFVGEGHFTTGAFLSDGQTLIAGDNSGQLHLLRLEKGPRLSAASLTAWRVDGQILAECPYCGQGERIGRLGNRHCVTFGATDVGRQARCPACTRPVQLNAFIIDRDQLTPDPLGSSSDRERLCRICAHPNKKIHIFNKEDFLYYDRMMLCQDCLYSIVSAPSYDWMTAESDSKKCLGCTKKGGHGARSRIFTETRIGSFCAVCIGEGMAAFAAQEDLETWSPAMLLDALSAAAESCTRFVVLYGIERAIKVLEREDLSRIDDLVAALFELLGYSEEHPLTPFLHQTAVAACIKIGPPMFPLLLQNLPDAEHWAFFANVVHVAVGIAPDDPATHPLLERAVAHPEVQVRLRVVEILKQYYLASASFLLEQLRQDEATEVQIAAQSVTLREKQEEQYETSSRASFTSMMDSIRSFFSGIFRRSEQSSKTKSVYCFWPDRIIKDLRKEKFDALNFFFKHFGCETAARTMGQALRQGLMNDPCDLEGAWAAAKVLSAPGLPALAMASDWKIRSRGPLLADLRAALPNSSAPLTWTTWADAIVGTSHRQRQHEEAEIAYKTALQLNPEYRPALKGLADLLQDYFYRFEEAARTYTKVLDLDPDDKDTWSKLGTLLHKRLHQYQKAEQAFLKAIEIIGPDRSYTEELWTALAELRRDDLNDMEGAEQAYLKAITCNGKKSSTSADLWKVLGKLRNNRLDDPKGAEQAYLNAISCSGKHSPLTEDLWIMLGDLRSSSLDDPKGAEQAYLKAIAYRGKYSQISEDLWIMLGDWHRERKAYTKAEKAYRKALFVQGPDDILSHDTWEKLGDLFAELPDRHTDAERAYRKAIELDSCTFRGRAMLGRLLHQKLHRPEEAETVYKEAITRLYNDEKYNTKNNQVLIRQWLADVYHDLGREEEEEAVCEEVVEFLDESNV
ncbi:hypothetical protein KKHLCK_08895 [Candidatus Electrothrix laxa]